MKSQINYKKTMREFDKTNFEFSIIIPAYNEEENLPPLLDEIINHAREKKWNYELIIVNDNSSDKTFEISNFYSNKYPEIRTIHRKSLRNGMGAALREGTMASKGKFVVWMMADRSDNLNTIPKILDKLNEGYDVVFASRYMKGGSRGDLDPVKAFLSSSYTIIARLIFGLELHDITNAFRGFRKNIFNSVIPECDDFTISPEFAIKAHLGRVKLGEVPTDYSTRKCGKSNFKIITMMFKYMKLLKYKILK